MQLFCESVLRISGVLNESLLTNTIRLASLVSGVEQSLEDRE